MLLAANSPLFPSRAALSQIFNKRKRFSFLNQKKDVLSLRAMSFHSYTSSYCQRDCSVLVRNESGSFIAAVFQKVSAHPRVLCGCLSEGRIEQISSTAVRILYKVVFYSVEISLFKSNVFNHFSVQK